MGQEFLTRRLTPAIFFLNKIQAEITTIVLASIMDQVNRAKNLREFDYSQLELHERGSKPYIELITTLSK